MISYGNRVFLAKNVLVIKDSKISDSGTYVCESSNIIASTTVEFHIKITEEISVRLERTHVRGEVGSVVGFKCLLRGSYTNVITNWWKNGQVLGDAVRFKISSDRRLDIYSVTREDEGIYQCVVTYKNQEYTAAGLLTIPGNARVYSFRSTYYTR